MSRRPFLRTLFLASFAGAAGTFGIGGATGCNAILDNEEGILAADGGDLDGAADVTTPPPSDLDATIRDAADAADSAPVTFDAALDAAPDRYTPPGDDDDGGSDASSCGAGQMLCGGACVSTTSPVYGCGAASCAPCSLARGVAGCNAGACVLAACDTGYADCNQNPADGCETDLSQTTHCGACNASCGAAAPDCTSIGGTFQCITGCPANQPTLCNGTCVDLTSSPTDCGNCGAPCPAVPNGTSTCTSSTCGFTCTSPYLPCNGGCVAPDDPAACGPSCTVCAAPAHANATCPASSCSFSCKAGFGDCNMDASDGCEAALVMKQCPVPDAGVDAGDSGT
jgi:hypothetical protein